MNQKQGCFIHVCTYQREDKKKTLPEHHSHFSVFYHNCKKKRIIKLIWYSLQINAENQQLTKQYVVQKNPNSSKNTSVIVCLRRI